MLLHHRRQDIAPPLHRTPDLLDSFNTSNTLPSPTDYNTSRPLYQSYLSSQYQQSRDFFDTSAAPASDFTALPLAPAALPPMSSGFEYSNPAIRVQHSTPTPPQPQYSVATSDSLAAASYPVIGSQGWDQYARRDIMQQQQQQQQQHHRRGLSSSSVASSSASPYLRNQFHSSVKPEHSPITSYLGADGRRGFSNLPTPTDTPTSDSFATAGLQSSSSTSNQPFDTTMAAHFAMKDMLMAGQEVAPDTPEFSHSGRHSVSSYNEHEAPTTPHTVSGDELDFRATNNQGESLSVIDSWINAYLRFDGDSDTIKTQHSIVPKFDRSISDIFQDELYNPVATSTSAPNQARHSSNPSLLSPYSAQRNLQERLQAANKARSTSPSSRDASPYRQASAYAHVVSKYGGGRYGSSQLSGSQKPEADTSILESQIAKQSQADAPKSVSPKDTILEYRETEADSKVPLFPEEEASAYETRFGGGNQQLGANATQGNYNHLQASAQSYTDMASENAANWATPQHPSSNSYSHSITTSAAAMNVQPHSGYGAYQQSMQIPTGMHGLPFASAGYRNVNGLPAHEDTPDFPAHLTSMESSMSEAAPTSSQNSTLQHDHIPQQKPASSLADTGTYSCTYHGCTQRFATPQKLQKHKREAHRSVGTHTTPSSLGSGMTSAQLLARNSQAGPHRCDRINPTTGKPCSTIFSRPYDLTRHEDTIHNARKQKVRCALCVEEKTFSRNDALTRHMRVVHPEVDFPGKHRRRGAGSD